MTEQNLAKIVTEISHILNDHHAIDVVTIDVQKQTTITSYMIICSGRSSRQVNAIAEHTLEKMKAQGYPAISVCGLKSAEWVLIDFGEAILHIMQPDIRAFYNLEGLWQAS
ncbi:MAG: ribosome silencing factor [Legionellales bacterium RIFCSPHIGHO2_12_FULL_37_14]|nr:MAG: ribosome silencing factor [Legionellales bacterium RIFCSPHIGHO2_12_FULL_37_14]